MMFSSVFCDVGHATNDAQERGGRRGVTARDPAPEEDAFELRVENDQQRDDRDNRERACRAEAELAYAQ